MIFRKNNNNHILKKNDLFGPFQWAKIYSGNPNSKQVQYSDGNMIWIPDT